jgi:hypothetical protein
MALLYFSKRVGAMAGSTLVQFDLVPAANGLRWLQVRFMTLGVLPQVLFGALGWLLRGQANSSPGCVGRLAAPQRRADRASGRDPAR